MAMPKRLRNTGRKRGGQPGNRNALRTGLHTREMRAMQRLVRLHVAALDAAVARLTLAKAMLKRAQAKT